MDDVFRRLGLWWCRFAHDVEARRLIFNLKLGIVSVCTKCRRIHR
jgi:hypothetical protein